MMLKYLFVFIFLFMFAWFEKTLGYTTVSPLYTHFTYMFQHAGVMHLFINSFAFIGMFRAIEKYVHKWLLAVSCILIGFAASFLSVYDIPTVGASGMIYAMIGMFMSITILYKGAKINDKRKYAVFILAVCLSLLVSYFKYNSNFWLHVYSLSMGVFLIIVSIYKNKKLWKI